MEYIFCEPNLTPTKPEELKNEIFPAKPVKKPRGPEWSITPNEARVLAECFAQTFAKTFAETMATMYESKTANPEEHPKTKQTAGATTKSPRKARRKDDAVQIRETKHKK